MRSAIHNTAPIIPAIRGVRSGRVAAPPPHHFRLSPRIMIGAGVSIVVLLLAGLFFHQVYAQPSTSFNAVGTVSVSPGTAYLSGRAAAEATSTAVTVGPTSGINIADDGLVLLRGAQVISISGSTINVQLTWGSSDFTWAVETAYNTQYFSSTGAKETKQDIQVGDIVTATGMLTGSEGEPAITAQYVNQSQ